MERVAARSISCGTWAPPRTRGSTRPCLQDEGGRWVELPRARGDRPFRGRFGVARGTATPARGNGAPAGPFSSLCGGASRLPRARGDVPVLRARSLLRTAGCPAHAGIDRSQPVRRAPSRVAPRTRGWPGEPVNLYASAVAPRTRGCAASLPIRLDVRGCPAHAGIGPRRLNWVPRASNPVAPRTRGSPSASARRSSLRVEGCPAHAGIAPRPPRRRTRRRLPRARGEWPRATRG